MNLRQIYSAERDVYLRQLKLQVIEGAAISGSEGYDDLIEEWKGSIERSIRHDVPALTDKQRDFSVFANVSSFTKYKLAYLDDLTIKRELVFSEIGCAIFYLDNNLSTFRAAGCKELLDELRRKGIRHGTQFTVENLGVFVGNQAYNAPGETLCRVGEENYLDIFSDYVCFARRESEELRDFIGCNVVFAPKSMYTEFLRTEVSFLLDVALDITNMVSYPFLETRHRLLRSIEYVSDEMMLLLDNDSEVVFTSEKFEKEFGKGANQGLFDSLRMFMPDMSFISKYIGTRREIIGREMLLIDSKNISHFYFVQFSNIMEAERPIGVKCVFQRTDQKKDLSQKQGGQEIRYTFDSIICQNRKMLELKELGRDIAAIGSNILIQGESGTGKELFSQSIHAASPKHGGPFIPVNCAAIPQELMNSELFGYENGAFTGALKGGYAGKFEQANGGTIFLDEVAEMPMSMQSSLLRVLEDNVISRLGGKRYISLDVRVVAATNKDLWTCVQNGTFRADLYFRLNIVKLVIPPLRERGDDIELLTEHMVDRLISRGVCGEVTFSPETFELFRGYNWPGNVRELRNMIERCVTSTRSAVITPEVIPYDVFNVLSSPAAPLTPNSPVRQADGPAAAPASDADGGGSRYRNLDRQRIEEIMLKYNGNKSKVAQELGMSRGTLYKKLKEFGMGD